MPPHRGRHRGLRARGSRRRARPPWPSRVAPMKFTSLLRFLAPRVQRVSSRRRPRLRLELLEPRDLPAVLPTIQAVLPPSSADPTHMLVTYSEDVTGAGVASNYRLFNSGGAQISISNANYSNANDTATLTINA